MVLFEYMQNKVLFSGILSLLVILIAITSAIVMKQGKKGINVFEPNEGVDPCPTGEELITIQVICVTEPCNPVSYCVRKPAEIKYYRCEVEGMNSDIYVDKGSRSTITLPNAYEENGFYVPVIQSGEVEGIPVKIWNEALLDDSGQVVTYCEEDEEKMYLKFHEEGATRKLFAITSPQEEILYFVYDMKDEVTGERVYRIYEKEGLLLFERRINEEGEEVKSGERPFIPGSVYKYIQPPNMPEILNLEY